MEGQNSAASATNNVPDSQTIMSSADDDIHGSLFSFQSTEPQRKRRRGGKGCGTCPARKIKCDERRPKCSNCERSRRYVCDGYGDDSSQNVMARTPNNDVAVDWANFLAFADNVALPLDSQNSVDEQHQGDTFMAWNPLDDMAQELIDPSSPQSMRTFSPGRVIVPSRPLQDGAFRDRTNLVDERNDTSAVIDVSSPFPNAGAMSPAKRTLLHHYRTHVCQLMMPTLAPTRNPWLQLYLPLALQEPTSLPHQALFYAILSVSAYNRSLLSSSDKKAFQEQGRGYNNKASVLLKSALDSDQGSLDLDHNKVASQALMAAALTLTTAEVFSGGSKGDWSRYLQICKHIIRMTGGSPRWLSDPTSLALFRIFRCLQIVSSTSGLSEGEEYPLKESTEENELPRATLGIAMPTTTAETNDCDADYSLDVSFGVSSKTLQYLTQVIEFSRLRSEFSSGQTWTGTDLSALASLERNIFEIFDDPEAFQTQPDAPINPSEGDSGYIADFIKENHMWAFHCSTAVFFRRAVLGGFEEIAATATLPRNDSDIILPRISGQELVSKAFDYLENIDAVSRDIAVANTLWPGFIAAVEAVDTQLRHRALIWLARARRHGIGNIDQAKQIVLEVWRRVDRKLLGATQPSGLDFGLSSVDWRQVMREKGMYIMLT